MLAYISLAIMVVLSFKGAVSRRCNAPEFDAFFPHGSAQLSYVTTDERYMLPENIVNFTLCFWIKPSAETWLSIFSYNAYPSREYGNELGFYLESQVPRSQLCVHEHCLDFPGPEVTLNAWQHFCVLYDGTNPKVTLVYNDGQIFELDGSSDDENYRIRGGGIIVLGQDQDTYGGGFDEDQSMRGRVNRLQMWDRMLDEDEVKQQMECDAPEGNVISWTKTPWVFRNGAKKVLSDICPAEFSESGPDEEADASECECSGTKLADLTKTFSDVKTEILAQLNVMKEKMGNLEEKNGVLRDSINLLTKNSVAILDVKQRNQVFEKKLDKMLLNLQKTQGKWKCYFVLVEIPKTTWSIVGRTD